MNLIDLSYFRGELELPNIGQPGFFSNAQTNKLNAAIDVREDELLRYLLGDSLLEAFRAGLEAETVEEKWSNLKAAIVDEERLISCIAYWVYYHVVRESESISTGLGELVPLPENSMKTSSDTRLVRAWNQTRTLVIRVLDFLIDNMDTYPEWETGVVVGVAYYDVYYKYRNSGDYLYLKPHNRFGI